MRNILISLLVLTGVVSVGAQADDILKFKGVITPISSPVVLRYRPFPKTPITQIKQVSIADNKLNQTQMSGFVESQLVDGLLLVTMSLGHEAVQLTVQFSIKQSGQFQGINKMDLNGKDFLSSASPETKLFMKQFENVMKSSFPSYDEVNGYATGDSIYDNDLNMNIMNTEIAVKLQGAVRGLTVHNGRDALVVDYVGTVSLDGKSGSANGYMLIDIATGF
jgi:hypothetical protein